MNLDYLKFDLRGVAGIVTFGAIRDYDTLHAGTFPVFAAGVTHRGPYKDGPGEINVPIAIDGITAPWVIDHFINGVQTSRVVYESVEYNSALNDSLFVKPTNIKSLK